MRPNTRVSATVIESQEPDLRSYGSIIEWHRFRLMGRVLFIWFRSSGVVTLGFFLVGLSFLSLEWLGLGLRVLLGCLGGALTLTGALYGLFGMHRLLREERYLALFQRGLLLREYETYSFVLWGDLMEATYEPMSHTLFLHLRSGERLPVSMRFLDIEQKELSKRVNQIRRKAQMGLKI